MIKEEFINFIESIGFKHNYKEFYNYNEYTIYLSYLYDFYNGSKWIGYIDLNNLTPLHKEFKKELRSIKLKELLR